MAAASSLGSMVSDRSPSDMGAGESILNGEAGRDVSIALRGEKTGRSGDRTECSTEEVGTLSDAVRRGDTFGSPMSDVSGKALDRNVCLSSISDSFFGDEISMGDNVLGSSSTRSPVSNGGAMTSCLTSGSEGSSSIDFSSGGVG